MRKIVIIGMAMDADTMPEIECFIIAESKEMKMRCELIDKHQVMVGADYVSRLTRDSFMALPERIVK